MKELVRVLLVFSLLATLVVASVSYASAADNKGFKGAWESIDCLDDSYQKLVISGGGNGVYRVTLHDSGASACDPSLVYACIAKGTGEAVEDVLRAELSIKCLGCKTCPDFTSNVAFTYDEENDQLRDWIAGCETIWYRMGKHQLPS